MHITMVPEQVKTMKIQAGIQVSRPRELKRQLQLWKHFGRLYSIVFVLVRNIVEFCLVEDLTTFYLKISLRFASRPHCVLLQDIHCVLLEDLAAFCLKTSLRFASRPHCVLLQVITANSDYIQAVGSNTRPPMLDRTDYESWSQRIRLYCRGKKNGLQILQSIDQGPFELGTTRDTLGTTSEGGVLLRPERPRTYDDLNDDENK
ncbi:hypothetical protein Tco_1515822 [Tanacetum coccineum]